MSLLTKALSGVLDYWRYGPAKLTDPALPSWLGASRSYAGKAVTVDGAMQIGAVYACVRLIAETVATLPCNVYVAGPDGRRLDRQHPIYGLLHDAPNADQTAVEFFEQITGCLLTHGNAYAEIDRILGRVVALTPRNPALMTVRRGEDGAVEYIFQDPIEGPRYIAETNMLHIRGFSLDGLLGLSPVAQAAHSLGIAMAADETAGKLFANGMRAGGYLASDQTLTKTQRDEAKAYLATFQGAANAGKIPLLEAGFKFQAMSLTPDDAELLASRNFSVEEICRWYRVAPHMVGHANTTTWGSGIEQMSIAFVTLTLRPWLKRIEMALKRRLLAPGERGSIEIEFNAAGLLRGDSAARASYYAAMVQNGLYTRDEVRDLENMPRRGGGADMLTIQSQNVPVDLAAGLTAPVAAGGTPA